MNKKMIILFGAVTVLIVVAVVLVISLTGGSKSSVGNATNQPGAYVSNNNPASPNTAPASQTIGAVTVHESVAGSRLVENSDIQVSLKIPEDWDISGDIVRYDAKIFGNGESAYSAVKAAWSNESASMYADIYSLKNKNKITPAEWAKNRGFKKFSAITVSGISGVRYITKVAYGSLFGESVSITENSYIVGFILPQDARIIDASCSVTGTDSELYKSKCDEIISTFSFIK